MIKDGAAKHDLPCEALNKYTIYNRVCKNNCSAYQPQKFSSLFSVEPILLSYCLRLAEMGSPLDKPQLILLANSLISGTKHEHILKVFKEKRNIENDSLVGNRWYRNFLNRHKHIVCRGNGKIRDVKRYTWCTREVFKGMYDLIHDRLVFAKIASMTNNPQMYDKSGNVVMDSSLMYGFPTKYHLDHPEMLIFVDETGCNTSQLSDGNIGGRKTIVPRNGSSNGTLGSSTDIHFTVLPFISGTGEAVMCAIILKS